MRAINAMRTDFPAVDPDSAGPKPEWTQRVCGDE